MSEKNKKIEIDKDLHKKITLLSEEIGMSINEIINKELKLFLDAFRSDPLSELEILGYEDKIKKVIE
jgi:negative regulator of replication initiation